MSLYSFKPTHCSDQWQCSRYEDVEIKPELVWHQAHRYLLQALGKPDKYATLHILVGTVTIG